ncbi:hemolysin XhlA family protein [Paraclostridium bifermentans]|uniref:hemolysin XhlA family protein n=1 Tax=Paraclostridium bifermentans TaxID=1490 RepID=UPI002430D82F|nr:hemolysin XhlA family protein [Paraclostridium bifermentans]
MNDESKELMLNLHEKRINNHSERIDKLEQNDVKRDTQIENLCKSIEGLTTSIKWALGLFAGSFVGFFFYAIQNHLFK